MVKNNDEMDTIKPKVKKRRRKSQLVSSSKKSINEANEQIEATPVIEGFEIPDTTPETNILTANKPDMPKGKESAADKSKVKTTHTAKYYMILISAAATILGLVMFGFYFVTLDQILGTCGAVITIAGILSLRYAWKKEGSTTTDHVGNNRKLKQDCNCLNLYPDKIAFETMDNPEGFPQENLNDHKKYYVNIFESGRLVPFVLPDQQYLDPFVFAQRVLALPAHRRIFERKPKLFQKLKTALLVLAIAILWLLILTTTGG